jgi:tRNA pseudouridine32 synthase/23S rRNA pseudouridine746 synthase
MVFALDADAQRLISLQFQRQRVDKTYVALLRGRPRQAGGTVELPLRTDWPNRPRQMVDHAEGKPARTQWTMLETSAQNAAPGSRDGVTRVEMRPTTGKTHQLRIHAATAHDLGGIGCPIVGDELYDPQFPAPRLMLHATTLRFADPDTLRRITFHSPCPF